MLHPGLRCLCAAAPNVPRWCTYWLSQQNGSTVSPTQPEDARCAGEDLITPLLKGHWAVLEASGASGKPSFPFPLRAWDESFWLNLLIFATILLVPNFYSIKPVFSFQVPLIGTWRVTSSTTLTLKCQHAGDIWLHVEQDEIGARSRAGTFPSCNSVLLWHDLHWGLFFLLRMLKLVSPLSSPAVLIEAGGGLSDEKRAHLPLSSAPFMDDPIWFLGRRGGSTGIELLLFQRENDKRHEVRYIWDTKIESQRNRSLSIH